MNSYKKKDIKSFLKRNIIQLFTKNYVDNESGIDNLKNHTNFTKYAPESIVLIELIIIIEKKYGIFFEDLEIDEYNFYSINRISDRIINKLKKKALLPFVQDFQYSERDEQLLCIKN